MNCGGVTSVYFNTVYKLKRFGLGTDNVKVYPCYAPSGNVKASADVRISEYAHADGSKVICVSSFGYEGNVTVDFAGTFRKAEDYEKGKPMTLTNGKSVSFHLKKHDYKLIKVSK